MSLQKTVFFVLIYILVFLLFCQLLVFLFNIPVYIFPSPKAVFLYIVNNFGYFSPHILVTVFESICGVIFAYILSMIFSILILYYISLNYIIIPSIFLLQILPIAALGPLLVIWFGFGVLSKIILVTIFAMYPIIMSFRRGIIETDSDLLKSFQLLRITRWQLFRYILFPNSIFYSFLGLQIALIYSIGTAILGESLGSITGLGVLISRAVSSYNGLLLFSTIYISIFITICLFFLSKILERYSMKKLGQIE